MFISNIKPIVYTILLYIPYYMLGIDGYNLCVIGAGGGLGREIVYQASKERNMTVLALTSDSKIYIPYRGDGYNNMEDQNEYVSSLVKVDNYWNTIRDDYERLVICTGGTIFEEDYSDTLTKKYLESLSSECKDVSIVSAYSVDKNTLEKFSIPFQIMSNVYLKDVYRAKREQERLLKTYNDTKIRKRFFKPRALSYGNTVLPSTTRQELAYEILDSI